MKVELKNVKYAEFASEETSCFEASVYIDGVKAGEVSNDGKGGCDNYYPYALQARLNEWAKTLPKYDASEFHSEPAGTRMEEHSAETAIGDLLTAWLAERDLKRMLGKRLLYTKPGQRGVWQSKVLPKDVLARKVEECKALVAAGKPLPFAEKCLNAMPLTEATVLFRAEARAS